MKTLVLNSDYIPLKWVSWEKALVNVLFKARENKVYVVEYYDKYVYDTQGREYQIPAVIALSKFVKASSRRASYTKLNIYSRDKFTCQYCSTKFKHNDLTVDHVIPRSRWNKLGGGGKVSCFENVVTACKPCNAAKSDKTCKEAKMHPVKKPESVSRREAFLNRMAHASNIPDEWKPYLKGLNENV